MTDTTIAIAPAISAMSAQYSNVVFGIVLTGLPRKVRTRALACSRRQGNLHPDFEIFLLHEASDELRDFICGRIQCEMTGIENMNLGLRHILAIAFRFAEIEREIIFTPDHQ
jgi:hypothetical protein